MKLICSFICAAEALFCSPKGWNFADEKNLPPKVEVMVFGKGKTEYPPSVNLCTETFDGTLADYLEIVKRINTSKGLKWKDLGKISTQSGVASLSQVDTITEYGPVRMMHVILVKDGIVYILTGTALQNEFAAHYKEFYSTFQSLNIVESEKNTCEKVDTL